jgi:hypothetical protein
MYEVQILTTGIFFPTRKKKYSKNQRNKAKQTKNPQRNKQKNPTPVWHRSLLGDMGILGGKGQVWTQQCTGHSE